MFVFCVVVFLYTAFISVLTATLFLSASVSSAATLSIFFNTVFPVASSKTTFTIKYIDFFLKTAFRVLTVMYVCVYKPKHSHLSKGAAVSVCLHEPADMSVAKQWNEKGKCNVIGTCGRQKELNFQYSS